MEVIVRVGECFVQHDDSQMNPRQFTPSPRLKPKIYLRRIQHPYFFCTFFTIHFLPPSVHGLHCLFEKNQAPYFVGAHHNALLSFTAPTATESSLYITFNTYMSSIVHSDKQHNHLQLIGSDSLVRVSKFLCVPRKRDLPCITKNKVYCKSV